MTNERTACFDGSDLRLLASKPDDASLSRIAVHVFTCEDCRRRFEDVLYPCDRETFCEEDAKAIESVVRSHCKAYNPLGRLKLWIGQHPVFDYAAADLRWRTAAASGAASGDTAQEISLVYVSDRNPDRRYVWRAVVDLSLRGSPNATMEIRLEDGCSRPVPDCVFTISNQNIHIKDGKGSISYQSFIAGLRDSRVVARFPDGTTSAGSLMILG